MNYHYYGLYIVYTEIALTSETRLHHTSFVCPCKAKVVFTTVLIVVLVFIFHNGCAMMGLLLVPDMVNICLVSTAVRHFIGLLNVICHKRSRPL